MDKIQRVSSTLSADMGQLLAETTADDLIHDVVFVVGQRRFPAHRFILSSSCGEFYKKICAGREDEDSIQVDDVPPEVFQLLLEFIYTGACSLPSILSSRSENAEADLDKRPPDRNGKENEAVTESALHAVRSLQSYSRKLGVNSLASLIDKVYDRETAKKKIK